MTSRRHAAALAAIATLALQGCSSGGGDRKPAPAGASATIGAGGGSLVGPDGVRLTVPPGALAADTAFTITRGGDGAPTSAGMPLASAVYAVTPHGTPFAADAVLSLPFDPAMLPVGGRAAVVRAQPGGTWQLLPEAGAGSVRLADLAGLSFYGVVACGPDQACGNSTLTLEVLDRESGSPIGAARDPVSGLAQPLGSTLSRPTTLRLRATWKRPAGVARTDLLSLSVGEGLSVLGQRTFPVPEDDTTFVRNFDVAVNPEAVPGFATGMAITRVTARVLAAGGHICWQGSGCTSGFDASTTVQLPVGPAVAPPVITQAPADQAVNLGQTATFTVAATGPALTYQWAGSWEGSLRFDDLAGATSASYTTPPATLFDNGAVFRVTVCSEPGSPAGRACVTSQATLTVVPPPVAPAFTESPLSLTILQGQRASLSATATGTPAPTLRWFQVRAPPQLPLEVGTPCAGSGSLVTCTYTTPVLSAADSGVQYYAEASNSAGTVASSAATISVQAPTAAPLFTQSPQAMTVFEGQSASLGAVASGLPAPTIRWFQVRAPPQLPLEVGTPCTDSGSQTACAFTTPTLSAADSGIQYYAEASNGSGTVASAAATITVRGAPASSWIGCLPGGAASGWQWVEPKPQGFHLAALAHDAGGLLALGPSGVAMRTSDRGGTWTVSYATCRAWAGLAAPEPGVLIATTGQDGIQRSTDGGASWTQVSASSTPLSSVAFGDPSTGLAVGQQLLRTTDGGLSWTQALPPGTWDLRDVAFASPTVAVAVGANLGGSLAILRSTDKGATWSQVGPGSPQPFSAGPRVAFGAGGVGIVLSASSEQGFRTTDLGATWTPLTLPPLILQGQDQLAALAFADGATVVALTGFAEVLRSTDGGAVFTSLGQPFGTISGSWQVRFEDALHGAIVGSGGLVALTADGGITWNIVGGDLSTSRRDTVRESPGGYLLASGASHLVRSTDDGATWQRIDLPVTPRDVAFPEATTAVAVADYGQIFRSADSGVTWDWMTQVPGGSFAAVAFGSATSGVAVGGGGLVMVTTDGGVNWAPAVSGTSLQLRGVAFAGPDVAVAVGDGGLLLRSTDGGATWSEPAPPGTFAGTTFTGVAFASDSVGMAVTAQGEFLRSVDAGLTWAQLPVATGGNYLSGISFLDAQHGIAVGAQAVVLVTDDGGQTWADMSLAQDLTLLAGSRAGPTTLVVVGDYGAILRIP